MIAFFLKEQRTIFLLMMSPIIFNKTYLANKNLGIELKLTNQLLPIGASYSSFLAYVHVSIKETEMFVLTV